MIRTPQEYNVDCSKETQGDRIAESLVKYGPGVANFKQSTIILLYICLNHEIITWTNYTFRFHLNQSFSSKDL